MFIEPTALLEQTIDTLQTLAAYLEDEVDERTRPAASLSPEARRCKEALLTINVLIPKLRSVQMLQELPRAATPRICANCEA
jgi:hypothetical protein